MKEYIPASYRNISLIEAEPHTLAGEVAAPTIIRRVKFTGYRRVAGRNTVLLEFEGVPQPIAMNPDGEMFFETESISLNNYLWRVIEYNDVVDIILDPRHSPQMTYLWIHIDYLEEPPTSLSFSRKDDGLFAMRTKSGEKAERLVAKKMVQDFGHSYPSDRLQGSGVFEIRYRDKKTRSQDLTCLRCRLSVEVKKRNKDRRYRISHSNSRPFWRENREDGWHALVFPDMSIHFLSNRSIIDAIGKGRFTSGSDRYDAWADLSQDIVREEDPPFCHKR
jgi:hypothetical protein